MFSQLSHIIWWSRHHILRLLVHERNYGNEYALDVFFIDLAANTISLH